MNTWSNLPNVKHIDAVLESVKDNPKKWADSWTTELDNDYHWTYMRSIARGIARREILKSGRSFVRVAVWYDAWRDMGKSTLSSVRCAVHDAILALTAYDDSFTLMNETPERVEMLARNGNKAAILLYPAVRAFNCEME